MENPEGAIAEREAQRKATAKETERTLEWVVYCVQCGEVDKAPNGALMEAVARRHKQENKTHTVILGTYQETV